MGQRWVERIVAVCLGIWSSWFGVRAAEIGESAPPFTLQGSDGKAHTLGDHAGKQVVVLAWFPKAFTGG